MHASNHKYIVISRPKFKIRVKHLDIAVVSVIMYSFKLIQLIFYYLLANENEYLST